MRLFFLYILFSQILLGAQDQKNKKPEPKLLPLHGNHLFVANFTDRVPLTEVHLRTHKNSPSLSHLYLNYTKVVTKCVKGHTEIVHRMVGQSMIAVTEFKCDVGNYRKFKTPYQKEIKIKRTREGEKTPKTYSLVYEQKKSEENLNFSVRDISRNLSKKTTKKREMNKVTFNYHEESNFIGYMHNRLRTWNPYDLKDTPYFETLTHHISDPKSPLKIEQKEFRPIVKELNLTIAPSKNHSSAFVIEFEFWDIKRECFKTYDFTDKGKQKTGCLAQGYAPIKKTQKLVIKDKTGSDKPKKIKVLLAQKYIKQQPLKVTGEKLNPSDEFRMKFKKVGEDFQLSLKSTD